MVVDHWCVWGRTKSATGQMVPHTQSNKRKVAVLLRTRFFTSLYDGDSRADTLAAAFLSLSACFRMEMFRGDAEWEIRGGMGTRTHKFVEMQR